MFPQQYKVDISLKPCHSSRPFSTCAKRLLKILNADTRLLVHLEAIPFGLDAATS